MSSEQNELSSPQAGPSVNERSYHYGIQTFRLLLCLFVVYNHVPPDGISDLPGFVQRAFGLLGLVAVPCFVLMSFFLSGPTYLQDQHLSSRQFNKRIKRLLLPFIAWSIVGFIVYLKRISPGNLILQFFFGAVVNAPLYYLAITIYFTLVFSILTWLSIKPRLTGLVLLAGLCFFVQYRGINHSAFQSFGDSSRYTLGRFCELLPYAVAGVLLRRYFDIEQCCRGSFRHARLSLATAAITLALGTVIWMYEAPEGFGYQGFGLVLCSLSFFVLFLVQPNSRISRIVPSVVMSASSVSLGIFCSHYVLNRIVRSWFGHNIVYEMLVSVPFLYGLLLYLGSLFLCLKIKSSFDGRLARFVS